MASAYDVANGSPQAIQSFDSWVQGNYGVNGTGNVLGDWTNDTFLGGKGQKREYEAYVKNLENMNEYRATQSARAWDKYLQDTQYQRLVADLKKAGLNPWLAVQSGISGASASTSGAKASYSSTKAEKSSKGNNLLPVLALVASVARLLV